MGLLAVTLFLALSPAATAAPQDRPATLRFDSGRAAESIPIEVAGNGLAFVRGRVRDSPLWLLLDTASPSVLGSRAARTLGLAEPGSEGRGRSEPILPSVIQNVAVALPGVKIRLSAVSSFDLDPVQTMLGHRVDGILGSDVFANAVVGIDWERRVCSFGSPRTAGGHGRGVSLPIRLEKGLPYVRARLLLKGRPPIDGDFLLDTGADNAVLLFSPFVDAQRILAGAPGAPPASGPQTGGGNFQAVLRIRSLDVGPFSFSEPILEASRSREGQLADPEHAGLLGGAILSRFRAVFDFPRGRVFLAKNASYALAFEANASGISLSAQAPDLKAFEVRQVTPGTPGAEAGLVAGDVLLAVDGRPAGDIGLREVRRLFQKDGRTYVLTIFREGGLRRVTLKCRRLL